MTAKEEEFKTILCLGSGYVGAMSMVIFATKHPNTTFYVYDVFKSVIDRWNKIVLTDEKTCPFVEKDLFQEVVKVLNKNLFFISEITDEIWAKSELVFICVNTPSLTEYKYAPTDSIQKIEELIKKGIELSMENVYNCVKDLTKQEIKILKGGKTGDAAAQELAKSIKPKIFIQKSTVEINTLNKLYDIVHAAFKENEAEDFKFTDLEIDDKISFLNIPEFLAEGCAVANLLTPDRVVIGHLRGNEASKKAAEKVENFYLKFLPKEIIIHLDSISSEMTKLVSNAMLAQRISSINSFTELCEKKFANIKDLSNSVGSDKRIGKRFLKASLGFGGSCFKKDILCLIYYLYSLDMPIQANYWAQVLLMNEYQRIRVCEKIVKFYKEQGADKPVALMGLAFKGDVSDTRCSNSIFVLSYLLRNKVKVKLYDPYVNDRQVFFEVDANDEGLKIDDEKSEFYMKDFKIHRDYLECIKDCGIVVFATDHSQFKTFELEKVYNEMAGDKKIIFDLYDNYDLDAMKRIGFSAFKVGVYDFSLDN